MTRLGILRGTLQVVTLGVVLAALPSLGRGQSATTPWSERKCALYGSAWQHATEGDGLAGIGPQFIAAHDAFVASGCREGRVCPVTAAELQLADTLTLMAVAEGMAGSFLPFACAPEDRKAD